MSRTARMIVPVAFVLALSAPGFCQGLDTSRARPLQVAMGDLEREQSGVAAPENGQRARTTPRSVRARARVPTPPSSDTLQVSTSSATRSA